MQFVRKLVGGRPATNIHQSTEEEALSLRHLRKLFMEFLHSPVPLTVREQESKLYMMLPLFCKVFGQAKPASMTEKFGDVCQFAAHVSRLMVNEIRRRAANQRNEVASKLILDFLMRDSAEDTVSGWNLLNTLNILSSADTPVVECMVAASLPSNMVKCLYLFYDLPPVEKTNEKTAEEVQDDLLTIQKLYTQVLVKLCNYYATSRELVHTDDLALLFTAISCDIPKHNVQWRSCVSEILMTLTRHGLDRDVVHYIHSKSCFAQCLMNMRKIQQVNPLELVEMIVTLVCCLKDSSAVSHYLLADFRSCHGYLFLTELLLMLGEMTGNEAREACRNVVLLVSSLVMIGHVTLRPLVSIGAPFQDPEFEVPEPIGGGSSVRNIEGFQVLQSVFCKTTDKLLCLNILDCINNIYCSDNANYFILEPQHTLSLFIGTVPEKHTEVQERIFRLLELVICNLNWVPCPELIAVSILFKNKPVYDYHQVALGFLIRILSYDPKYKDVFRDVGVLEVLTNCLKQYADGLKEKYDETVKTASCQQDGNTFDDPEDLVPDYPFLLMGCLRLLLENNSTNATEFRECGGARCIHNIVPYSSSRTEALKIIRELILSGGNDDLGTLLGLMHSTPQSEVKLKTDVLDALLKVFDLDPRTRAVFREVGGFVYVMSVLINMEGSLASPVSFTWIDVVRGEVLILLRTVFHVLTAAIQDDPANKNFMDEIRFRGLSDTIRLLGCFSLNAVNVPSCCAGEEQKKWTMCERQFSQHVPLSAQPSGDSIRSSVTFEGTLDLNPHSVLFAANEMLKNLFDMATDSFCLKSGSIIPVELTGRNGLGIPYIYHPGAVTAAVDLLPAVSEMNGTVMSEGCLELQLYWICHLQNLLKCEHNQQMMCEAGLPQQILDRCEAALITEEHPLHAPLQRMFERLASQSLTPTVLRDFLRLGFPLYCQSLEAPNETSQNTAEANDETILEENPEDKTEESQDLNESLRKISDVTTPRKVSDIVNRKLSDSEARSNTLTFRDVMLSMIQPSSESGSDVESNSDEDEFLIVPNANPDPVPTCSGEGNEEENTESDDTPPRPPPRRSKANSRRSFERSLELESNLTYGQEFQVTMETDDEQKDVVTAEVDGVDIDTIGNTAQQVACIDQGEDTVILDLKGKAKEPISDSSTEQSPERTHSESNVEVGSDNDDENLLSEGVVSNAAASPHKAAEMSFDEFSMRLSQIAESNAGPPDEGSVYQQTIALNEEGEDADDVDKDDDEEESCQLHGGGAVSLTRVKCVVSMTTPRDARAHGSTDCPCFVEFDMSVDGFGCLFLPAIAPQVSAGIATVSSVMAPAAVMGGVPGVGVGERMFPPQAGLTFLAWICVDQYSDTTEDQHPVRLMTIMRQFRSGSEKIPNVPCLSISISAKDRMLVVCTDETGCEDGYDSAAVQSQREREHTEARFLSDQLLEEGRWHHVMVVLNKALIRNSTCALFVDGKHVNTCRLKYIQAAAVSPDATVVNVAPYISAYLGTPPNPNYRRCSRLLWRLGPTHLIEEPLSGSTAEEMYRLGPNYVGSYQAPCPEGQVRVYGAEGVEPLVSEDKVMFGIHGHAKSVLTLAKIRKHFRKSDTRAVARELGLSTHDNTTPVRLIHNTAAHLQGASRTIGAIIIGCSGVRTFCPNPVSKLIECIGGVSALLGLVAMATDVEGLYASVKALSCVLRSNPSARRDMERTRGYQILALLFRRKKHLLNTHILHLTFALVGTVDSDRESSVIPNRVAFKDLLCDLEVWREAPADLQRSLFSHFLELLGPGSESVKNAELMQRLNLVPKLLFVLQDDSVTDSTAHTIASVLSVLLSNTNERKNLLRFGQFLVSTLPAHPANENELKLDAVPSPETITEGGEGEETLSPRRICLRNVMLELILCLIYAEGGELDHSFADALHETLGFDWLLLFIQAHLHNTTVVRATRILVTMLSSPPALNRFREGLGSGNWLDGTEIMLNKTTYVVAGFNVGSVADNKQKYQINREVCTVPGFLMLDKLLPKHIDIPEVYHLVIALLLGHPVSDVYAGVQFDWDSLTSVFWSPSSSGVKFPTPSPQEPGARNIYCAEAAHMLLSMANIMVNEAWEDTADNSRLREYPETLIQFLLFLYRNISSFSVVCTSQEFLEKLVAVLFPKRRNLAKFQELASDSENEWEPGTEAEPSSFSSKTLLITHPARKCVFEFLRVIMTDALTSPTSAKSLGVIDTILESYPLKCSQPQQAEFQTEVLCAQIDFFLGGNLLTNPSAGSGNHAKIVANAFSFASKVVDKLWIGNFVQGYKTVFNFLTSMIEAVKGQSVSLDSAYHSLNRTILFQLSRPLARLTDQTSLLEFLHILTTNHKLVFAPVNNEPDFIAGLCHWLLVMGTHKSLAIGDKSRVKENKKSEAIVGTPDVGEEATEEVDSDLLESEEESSCTRLLAAAAERVWDIFVQNKREAMEDAFRIALPKPSFTSYSSRDYVEHMPMGGASNLNLDLKSVRPLIGEVATRMWLAYISVEERRKAETLGTPKTTVKGKSGPSLRMLSRKTSRKENKDPRMLLSESHLWRMKHTKVVRDLVRLHHKNHLQNYQLISKSVAEEWALMDADLTRERGLWGPPSSSQLDKWALDMVEGPHRMRKKMYRNDMFYLHYPYDAKVARQNRERSLKGRVPISSDSKIHYKLRGRIVQGVGPIEALTQQQVSEGGEKKVLTMQPISSEPSNITEENEGSEVDNNQTIVKLLEAGETITSMFRCATIQGLDTAEGLFLFGKEHFYVVDGVTLLSTKEIKDIDSLPQGTHDPIIPTSSHDKPRSSTTERMCSKWAYEDIREVHKRRYLFQETALEVFSSDGRNHFLVFPKPVRSKVYDKLVARASTLRENAEESVVGMKRDTDVEAGLGLINTLMGERSVTQRWERGEITNFQYLMHLNTLAGRSYNDLMQYPVFPWVLADYQSEELDLTNPKTFRVFSKPMGAQSKDRLMQFQKKYREWEDPTGEIPPYHYGTHYSSTMIVASYLIRLEPFTQHFLRVQGNFDLPDRLFHSVKDAWLSAAKTNMADVKELIPEFFYLPEFLTNHNKFEFGTKQNGEVLGDIILPPWAKGDPREFIRLHRKALECDYVSAHLHEWIDLIFGYKQQGPLAEEANNVFYYYYYESNVDFHRIDDPIKKKSIISMIDNFGQTPKQLFKRAHPPKRVFRSVESDAQTGTLVNVDRLFFHNLPNLVPSAQPVKELKGPVGQMIQTDNRGLLAVEKNKVLVPPHNNRYIAWGFGDLSMRTGFYETERILAVYENFHIGQVLCASCPDSHTLITGGTSTLVCVWDMVKSSGREKKPQIILHEVLYGHHASVTCLAVSTAYNLIVSGSEDKTCIVWDLSKLTYVRQLSQHMAPITAIAINDLTGDIATCAGTYLYVWSVNGQLIAKENTSLQNNNHIQCCAMSELSEWDEENVILTGSMDGVVRFWGIEFFDEAAKNRRRSLLPLSPKSDGSTPKSKQVDSAAGVRDESQGTGTQYSSSQPQLSPDSSPTGSDKASVDQSPQSNQSAVISEQAEPRAKLSSDETSEEKSGDHVTVTAAEDSGKSEGVEKRPHVTPNLRDESIDEDYVIIHHKGNEKGDLPKPVWRRRLVLRHKLTMHTAFAREDNAAPAAITSLLVSKDHRKLLVGDFRGRIYSWSVTDAAGRMADHWVKDEFADLCSSCGIKFKFIERRHHCRDCGKVFCARCSSYESEVTRLGIHAPVRVCHACYSKLKKSSKKTNS
ncbi:WD repeat and FYVE domain-containing protein 3-like isoform X3 [Oculina patagonica]